jgi:hypothetical protein
MPTAITRPRAGSISDAMAYSGIGRSKLFEYAEKNPGLFKKNGRVNIVDFRLLDQIIDALPTGKIKPPPQLVRRPSRRKSA